MKTSFDPRHISRQKTVQSLFEWTFTKVDLTDQTAQKIIQNLDKIDKIIAKAAPEWPVEKISKIDLAILRLAVYEISVNRKAPLKVIIDEAIELAKEFGGDTSSKFINGAMGKVVKDLNL